MAKKLTDKQLINRVWGTIFCCLSALICGLFALSYVVQGEISLALQSIGLGTMFLFPAVFMGWQIGRDADDKIY